jgi:hypothetical protein
MAVETAIHRWDAETAHAVTTPIDAGVGVNGIEELLDSYLPLSLTQKAGGDLGGSLHLHATDVDAAGEGEGEWLVRVDGGTAEVRHEHEKGDLAIRGAASDLLLLMWGRLQLDAAAFETFGDAAILDRWRALGING